jgi:hypothetical protein
MSPSKSQVHVRTYREVCIVTELKTLTGRSVVKATEKAQAKLGKAAAKKFSDFTEDGRYALVLASVSHQVVVGEPRFLQAGAIDGTVPGIIVSTASVDREIA